MTDNAQLLLQEYTYEIKGRKYVIKPLPLKYILNGEFVNDGLMSDNKAADLQLYNIIFPEKRIAFDKWLSMLVTCEGKPMSVKELAENGFDLGDLGFILQRIIAISG